MSSFEESDYQFDLKLIDRVNRKRAQNYASEVSDLVAERMFERLALINSEPKRVLDLGAGNGRHLKKLRELFPAATVFAADLSVSLLHQARSGPFWKSKPPAIGLDASSLPFADDTFDLIVSNMMLPWIHPPDRFAVELNRALSPEGVFFFSTAGPDTLAELRAAWAAFDSSVHINALLDMHDIGDALLRAGIADPVVDVERLQLNYSSVDVLLDELIAGGALSMAEGRRKGLIGSDIRKKLADAYPLNCEGGVSATLEVVYAHGWKGQPASRNGVGSNNEFFISVDSLRRR